ncbi:MAG: aminodeoxychorismate/anthranilate synthase component II [Cyclobacteriaceae bacterium]
MKILVLDNYDSFTYNLVHILRELEVGEQMDVIRNDKIAVAEVDQYDKILLSPGPGVPSEAGIMQELIRTYAPTKSMLGICLGHQGIAEAFGSALYNMPLVLHGYADTVYLEDEEERLFTGLPSSFGVCRYHSWAVKAQSLNGNLRVTARDIKGEIMGLRHQTYDVHGLQFHPESILTEHGKQIIQNWLSL